MQPRERERERERDAECTVLTVTYRERLCAVAIIDALFCVGCACLGGFQKEWLTIWGYRTATKHLAARPGAAALVFELCQDLLPRHKQKLQYWQQTVEPLFGAVCVFHSDVAIGRRVKFSQPSSSSSSSSSFICVQSLGIQEQRFQMSCCQPLFVCLFDSFSVLLSRYPLSFQIRRFLSEVPAYRRAEWFCFRGEVIVVVILVTCCCVSLSHEPICLIVN